MTRTLLIALLVILVGYGLIEALPLLAGPSLSIESPRDYSSFTDGIVLIHGQASHIVALTLDGAPLLHDENGVFSTTLSFPSGSSILTFIATDRFGRHITTTRTIFVP